jgi:hypothetical protein
MVMMLQTLLCRAIKLVTTMVLPTVRATVDNFCLQRKETGAAAVSPRACFLWPPPVYITGRPDAPTTLRYSPGLCRCVEYNQVSICSSLSSPAQLESHALVLGSQGSLPRTVLLGHFELRTKSHAPAGSWGSGPLAEL